MNKVMPLLMFNDKLEAAVEFYTSVFPDSKLVDAGATPTQCGWITDPFGLSWQIVPKRFTELSK